MPQSGWPLPPGCGRRTPPGHRLRRSVPPADTAVAGRATDMADLSTGRTSPVRGDPQPMGLHPVRTAAAKRRTPQAPSVRPCAWPAGHDQLRGLDILALTRQDGNVHARLRPTPAATSIGTDRTRPPAPVLDAGTSISLIPVRCPRGRVQRPGWTLRSDRLSDTACPVVCGRTPSTAPRTPW
jgi:hypothetical protein